jgi:hypothetical protein
LLLEALEKKKGGKLVSQRGSSDENCRAQNRLAVRHVPLQKAERYSGLQRES